MPAVISAHVALRTRLTDTVTDTIALNDRLEAIVAVRPSRPGGGFHGKIDFSQPPWHAQAAHVVLDLHAWAREAEAISCLRARLPRRVRGGSTANTRRALARVCAVAESLEDDVVYSSVRWLDGWCRKAQIVLGEREAVRRLPRYPGQPDSVCPWCQRDSLRQRAQMGVIFCVNMACRDEDGKRPRAELEMFGGEWVLRWQDSLIGTPPPPLAA